MTQSHKQLIRQKIKEIDDLKRKGNDPESQNKRRIAFLVEGISGDCTKSIRDESIMFMDFYHIRCNIIGSKYGHSRKG